MVVIVKKSKTEEKKRVNRNDPYHLKLRNKTGYESNIRNHPKLMEG